ncbi:chitobiase/beta-hexosaminidase C-terminal domain-containing protein [Neorhodopirellula lusitana]|uniref:chitobiase/beta-hexosaminidase C-terminal domain-containing protein n=1 Tax=Neorhodopirellula lusitana TaxID=445327 RepID=UPI00384D2246
MSHLRFRLLTLALFLLPCTTPVQAASSTSQSDSSSAVEGRYVCFGNGLSPILGVAELEVYSGGTNVVFKKAEDFTLNCITGRAPESDPPHFRNLVDGNKNTLQRWPYTFERCADGVGYKDGALSHCSFEVDLHETMPIDKIEFYRSRYIQDDKPFKLFQDLGWRYLLVLNEERQIVAYNVFNIYPDDWREVAGHWTFVPQPATGAPAGRVVPKDSLNWLSEAEFIRDFLGKPTIDLNADITDEDRQRLERFQKRNHPAEIDQLGETFFRIVDLERPGLSEVKSLVKAKRYADALEAFKAPFFRTLSVLKHVHGDFEYSWMTNPNSRVGMRARDLKNQVYGDKADLTVKQFTPGLLPPAKFEYPFQMQPLLLNYAGTGDVDALRMWESMTDDWAIGFQNAADAAPKKLRDHFVLSSGAVMDNLLDLVNTAHDRPEFVQELSGATLARYLLPVLEEFPVSIWRVCRTVSFNHTYNAVPGGWLLSRAIMDFRAGQRLEKEMRQAFARLYTYNLYRDGSMVEVGDEGHYMATIHSPTRLYGLFEKYGRPDWFTPAMETYFLDHLRASVLSHAKNTSPSGAHVRWSTSDNSAGTVELELGLTNPSWKKPNKDHPDYYPVLCKPFLNEPQPRAIVDTVYGNGREPLGVKQRDDSQKRVSEYYGDYQGKPNFVSDWLPYSGLWYFRGGWNHNDSLLHMVSPTSPNSNGGSAHYPVTNRYAAGYLNVTSYRFHDYASPLMTGLGVLIDGLPPCPEEGRTPSGSKQDVFSQAAEKPQQARWYTDNQLDFGEAIYQGNYLKEGADFDHKLRKRVYKISPNPVNGVTTTRQIFQARPARLFLQVDRVKYASDDEKHTNKLNDIMILTDPDDDTVATDDQLSVDADKQEIRTTNPNNAGVLVRLFGQSEAKLTVNPKEIGHGSFRRTPTITFDGLRNTKGKEVFITWEGQGETVILSLLRAHAPDESAISDIEDLSDDHVVGIRATMTDGVKVSLLVSRRSTSSLSLGPVQANSEAVLLLEQPGQSPSGLVLGARSVSIDGSDQTLATKDLHFTLDGGFQQTPIRRPIDPPTIGPENTFTGSTQVTITTDTPNAEIRYIAEAIPSVGGGNKLAGTDRLSTQAKNWKQYTGPFEISEDTFVRARAFRQGVTEVPFTSDGTDASEISYGFFTKAAPLPSIHPAQLPLSSGLEFDYMEDRWFALWSYSDVLPAKKSGTTESLLDVSMRETDEPFAVRYQGYVEVPETGTYTFYGTEEYINNTCEPGYDLRVYVDGHEWDLGQTWHGIGKWSIPLEKGLHELKVTFADARAKDLQNQRIDLWGHYPWAETVWTGQTPEIQISGPGMQRQTLPNEWLKH